jgi:hypothetical protein
MLCIYHAMYLPWYVSCGIYLPWDISTTGMSPVKCVKFFNLSVPWGMVDPMPGTWTHKCKTNDFAPYVKFCVFTLLKRFVLFYKLSRKIFSRCIAFFFQVGPSNFFQTPLSIFFLFFPNFHFSKRV